METVHLRFTISDVLLFSSHMSIEVLHAQAVVQSTKLWLDMAEPLGIP